MREKQKGFTLVELIAVLTLLGVLSVVLMSRMDGAGASRVQASRDDVIAALFFAQQLAMSEDNVRVVVSSDSIDIQRNNISVSVDSHFYPLTLPSGIQLTSSSTQFVYDKLGRTSAGSIQVQTRDGRYSTQVQLETTGYAH